jgi:ribosomal protein L33
MNECPKCNGELNTRLTLDKYCPVCNYDEAKN